MHPSATAERTGVGRLGQGLVEGLGGAFAADAAQGHSRSRRHLGIGIAQLGRKPGHGAGSRRTPSELMTPISSRPCSLARACDRASSATGPGMASRAMRAQEARSGSDSSGASAGTALLAPQAARALHASAFSPGGAWDSSTPMSFCSLSARDSAAGARGPPGGRRRTRPSGSPHNATPRPLRERQAAVSRFCGPVSDFDLRPSSFNMCFHGEKMLKMTLAGGFRFSTARARPRSGSGWPPRRR